MKLSFPATLRVTPCDSKSGNVAITAAFEIPRGFSGASVVCPETLSPCEGIAHDGLFTCNFVLGQCGEIVKTVRTLRLFRWRMVSDAGHVAATWSIPARNFFDANNADIVQTCLHLMGFDRLRPGSDDLPDDWERRSRVLAASDRRELSAFALHPTANGGPGIIAHPDFSLVEEPGAREVPHVCFIGPAFWGDAR